MEWAYDDGGREAAGFKGSAGDCVTRAITIATGLPYREVYDELFQRQRDLLAHSRSLRLAKAHGVRPKASPREGVLRKAYEPYLFDLGWIWLPTMRIGQGCTVHLCTGELPATPLIVALSRHVAAVRGGVVRDTHDPTRDGTRCVYGYYEPGAEAIVASR